MCFKRLVLIASLLSAFTPALALADAAPKALVAPAKKHKHKLFPKNCEIGKKLVHAHSAKTCLKRKGTWLGAVGVKK